MRIVTIDSCAAINCTTAIDFIAVIVKIDWSFPYDYATLFQS